MRGYWIRGEHPMAANTRVVESIGRALHWSVQACQSDMLVRRLSTKAGLPKPEKSDSGVASGRVNPKLETSRAIRNKWGCASRLRETLAVVQRPDACQLSLDGVICVKNATTLRRPLAT